MGSRDFSFLILPFYSLQEWSSENFRFPKFLMVFFGLPNSGSENLKWSSLIHSLCWKMNISVPTFANSLLVLRAFEKKNPEEKPTQSQQMLLPHQLVSRNGAIKFICLAHRRGKTPKSSSECCQQVVMWSARWWWRRKAAPINNQKNIIKKQPAFFYWICLVWAVKSINSPSQIKFTPIFSNFYCSF